MTHQCVCVSVYVYLCCGGQRSTLSVIPRSQLSCFLREGLSLTTRDAWIWLGRLAIKPISASPNIHRLTQHFTWVLGLKLGSSSLHSFITLSSELSSALDLLFNIFPFICVFMCIGAHVSRKLREFILGVVISFHCVGSVN